MVLDRGAGEGQAVARHEEPAGLRGLRGRVLDGLRLIEDHRVELDRGEVADVATQGAVGRHDDVELGETLPQLFTACATVFDDLELGCEMRGLVDPVVHHTPRRHDQERQTWWSSTARDGSG